MTRNTRKPTTRPQQPDAAGTEPKRVRRAARRRSLQPKRTSTRREFLKTVGAAGATLGVPWNAISAADHATHTKSTPPPRILERQTLFFNLSHISHFRTRHFITIHGVKYELTECSANPGVLAAARMQNAFLRDVPDHAITHHLEGAAVDMPAISLAYLSCNEDESAGTWEMTGMTFMMPLYAHIAAYKFARLRAPTGPLPLSAKRRMYGAPPAVSGQDFMDEAMLIDPCSFATAVTGSHPDILSISPLTGGSIQNNYLNVDSNVQFLGGLLSTMGPAAPEGTTSATGMTPWATLKPLINNETGQPFKKSDGKLNQYYPDWDSSVDSGMAAGVSTVHPLVKDDPTLGFDATGFNLNDPNNQPYPVQLLGKVWARHDGVPTVMREGIMSAAAVPTHTFQNQNVETGLYVNDPDVQLAPDGVRVQVILDDVSNWFLRWLGVWVQFLDPNGIPLKLNTLPNDTFPAEPGPYPRTQDQADAMFLGVVSPAVAVLGIPVYPGQFSPTLYMPQSASTLRVFYTGLGLSGSLPQSPTNIYDHGALMTMAFNYGVVGLFMAAGSSTFGPTFKLAVSLGGGSIAAAIQALVGGVTDQANFAKGLLSFAMGFLKTLFGVGVSKALVPIVTSIGLELLEAEIIDSIPVAGQIARAVAAVTGALQLAETSIEVAISPAAYIFDLVETHNLSVTFLPDVNDSQFPQPPAGYTLYYKVSYLFNNGTAHVQNTVDFDPTQKSLTLTIPDIPYGGLVNVSIGFYMRKNTTPAGLNDWCAGHGTTGLVDNTVDVVPPPSGFTGFPITQVKVPIQSTTIYIHTRKSALIDAQGHHAWASDPDGTHGPPYVPPPNGQQPGLGGFQSITVRQGTLKDQGYVGYSWTAFSTGVNGCAGPAPGQFDQMANLNTDAGNNGANAENGYINSLSLCGFQPGVRMGYSLLTDKAINMYLDTTSLLVRPITLDPPGFAGPGSGQSYAQLNLDSVRCLLHPAGHIVSIYAGNKIETLRLPSAAQPDATTAAFYLARTFSGMGTRPGLMMGPAAAAISPDGAILVLEAGNNRIQAFDLGGNPVPFFSKQPVLHFLTLDATAGATYLDLAVEFTGYLYVLSKNTANVHRLDIYHPAQSGTAPICTTMNLNAAKLTVDFWRNVYSLNYEVLRLPGSNQIPSFTEPSVSLWVPPPPTT